MRKTITQHSLPILILTLAILSSTTVRIVDILGKKVLFHDEAISYLAATGHQGEYAHIVRKKLFPVGTWVHISEWKRFLTIEKRFCFKQICVDLAYFDIHPPLYFWLLHVWSLIFGVDLWTGPSLNIVIAFVTAIFLFQFARDKLGNVQEAVIVTVIWVLSPAVIMISSMARHYELLALCALLFVRQTIRYANSTQNYQIRESILLAILTTFGALTHYHFSVIIIGGSIFLIVKLVNTNKRRLITGLISMGIGGLLFVLLLCPDFYLPIIRRLKIGQGSAIIDIFPRVKIVLKSFFAFFMPMPILQFFLSILPPGVTGLLLSLLILTCIVYWKKYGRVIHYIITSGSTMWDIWYFFLWITGAIVFLYLINMSPRHAMGERYLSMVWPFYAFILGYLLRAFKKFKMPLTILLCIVLLMGSAGMSYKKYTEKDTIPSVCLEDSEKIIVDNIRRGVFLPVLWHIPDDKLIFAASQEYLLEYQESWRYSLNKAVYITTFTRGSTEEHRQEIFKLMGQECEVTQCKGKFGETDKLFAIRKTP